MRWLPVLSLVFLAASVKAQQQQQLRTEFTISVPVPLESIASLKVGGKPVSILWKKQGPGARIILLDEPRGLSGRRALNEVRSAQALCPACFENVEVWATGGEVEVGKPMPSTRFTVLIEEIADLFAGRGPVELYWINDYHGWLDCRTLENCGETHIDHLQTKLANAGLALYLVVVPGEKTNKQDDGFLVNLFGGKSAEVDPADPGAVLARLLRESLQHSTIRFSYVPGNPPWKTLPSLEVRDNARRRVYRRRFEGSNDQPTPVDTPPGSLPPGVYRIPR